MGSVSSKTGIITLDGTDQGDNSDTVSETGTGHGSWASLPASEQRRTASAPSKPHGKSLRTHARAKPATDPDQQVSKLSLANPASVPVPVHQCHSEGNSTIRQCFPLLRDSKVHPSCILGDENLECSKSLVEVKSAAEADVKTDLKRYKKYILECQNQERIAVAKFQEVEKQLAEVEGLNLRLQDDVQLLEEKVEYLQEAESQPHNYAEMLKMKDKYIQNLGKETHVIRAEVTQLKAKYKKKLKEKSSQISEMRQLHCIQMMEIKTEMEKLMEENENLSDQLSRRSEQGAAADRPPEDATSKHEDRRTDVIVQLSAKVSEQESRIISLENRLRQREKQLNELVDRTKSSSSPRHKQESGDAGDSRRRRDGATVDRHCQSEVMVADWDKRPGPGLGPGPGGAKHGSEGRLTGARARAWDDAVHDGKTGAKSAGDVTHKSHTATYPSHYHRRQSYSSTSDVDDDNVAWEDEDLPPTDRRNGSGRGSTFFSGGHNDAGRHGHTDPGRHGHDDSGRHGHNDATGRHGHDEPGRHSHHGYGSHKNKNHNNDLSATDTTKPRQRQRDHADGDADNADTTAADSRHGARGHVDTTHVTA